MRRRYAVILMPHALDDLDALHAFIAQDSPETADEVYARLRTAILVLQDFPLPHPLARERRFRKHRIRAFVVASYRIYYVVSGSAVYIIRLWHTSRKPPRDIM